MNYSYLHPRDEIALTLSRIYRYKMTTTSGGNLSIIDENGDIWITPSRVDKGTLKPEDIVMVRKGKCQVGRTPSHAVLAHEAIYHAHPEINCIINASPVNALAFSVCHKEIDTRTLPECYIFLREVGLLDFEISFNDYEEMARRITSRNPAAVLCNNGVMVVGNDLLATFDRLEMLECSAEAILDSLPIGGHVSMGSEVIDEICDVFNLEK